MRPQALYRLSPFHEPTTSLATLERKPLPPRTHPRLLFQTVDAPTTHDDTMPGRCPKLTALQTRFLASFVALVCLALVYWSLSNPHVAYAAELSGKGVGDGEHVTGRDHNWHRIEEAAREDAEDVEGPTLEQRQVNRSTITGNDHAHAENIEAGQRTVWEYPRELLYAAHADSGSGLPENIATTTNATTTGDGDDDEVRADLRKRSAEATLEARQENAGSRPVYVSINTCLQPTWSDEGTPSTAPSQLRLFVSEESSNTSPGPNSSGQQREVSLDEGFAQIEMDTQGDTYLAVVAPDGVPSGFSGVWNYELAVSIDGFYHKAELQQTNLFLIDTDNTAALLVTSNLTEHAPGEPEFEAWMAQRPPYGVLASNVAEDAKTRGLRRSYCGLAKVSQVMSDPTDLTGERSPVATRMTTRGQGARPKQQFALSSLNASSTYEVRLALVGNGTASGSGVVGGGGKVWPAVRLRTKTDGNCALAVDLSFCAEVAYAVPAVLSDSTVDFRAVYDNYTRFHHQRFLYSLQQYACHETTPADERYSLAHDCDDCAAAYAEWLCAVSIPRCADFSAPQPYLHRRNMGQPFPNGTRLSADLLAERYEPMPRAPRLPGSPAFGQTYASSHATNASRNPVVDAIIRPGPYKEVLPCEDLCWRLVQSCPASMGFMCPEPGRGLEASYGDRSGNADGDITCSYLGAYVYTNGGAPAARVSGLLVVLLCALMAWW